MANASENALNEIITTKRYGTFYNEASDGMNCQKCAQMKQTKDPENRALVEKVPNITIRAGICGSMSAETLGRKKSPHVDNRNTPTS